MADRMNPELKAQWVAALRSGEYAQCKGELHDGQGYCCIGVYGRVRGVSNDELRAHPSWLGKTPAGRLAPLEEIGLLRHRYALSALNDDGKTFSEIANWIEENL